MIFNHIQKSHDQLIIFNGNDAVQIFLKIREDMLARSLHCSTVRYGIYMRKGYNFSFFQRRFHTGCSCRLYSDHPDMRIQKLRKSGNTGSQTAAANRYKNIVYKRKLLDDLHGNGTLSGGNCRIIKGMDKRIAFLFCQLQSISAGFIIDIALQDHLCSIAFCPFHLNKRRCGRHYDDRLYPEFVSSIGNTLSVISG